MYKWATDDEITAARLNQTGIEFGGDGSDGALTISGSDVQNIDLGGQPIVIKNYTSISITDTAQLTFSNPATIGSIVILKSQGDVAITSTANPAIDISGMGGAGSGGAGPCAREGGIGVGNNGYGYCCTGGRAGIGQQGKYDFNGSGGGGGGNLNFGSNGSTYSHHGDSGYCCYLKSSVGGFPNPPLISRGIVGKYLVFPGGGGAGGLTVGSESATAHTGGAGGGALVIECDGALNFTGIINANGLDGGGGTDSATHYGGGGGAGGTILILYKTLTANTGTVNVNGGTGGPKGTGLYPGAVGGNGSVGQVLIEKFYD